MTWMNATENNKPITPRTGYVVETMLYGIMLYVLFLNISTQA